MQHEKNVLICHHFVSFYHVLYICVILSNRKIKNIIKLFNIFQKKKTKQQMPLYYFICTNDTLRWSHGLCKADTCVRLQSLNSTCPKIVNCQQYKCNCYCFCYFSCFGDKQKHRKTDHVKQNIVWQHCVNEYDWLKIPFLHSSKAIQTTAIDAA